MTAFTIRGTGQYLPRTTLPSAELDRRFGREPGSIEQEFGIRERRIADPDETSSKMAALAAIQALARAGWQATDLDAIIGGCGVMEQPIPSTAIMVQRRLGLGKSGITAFDVNQTCLSFVVALDVALMGIETGRWKRVLVFAADIASAGTHGPDPKIASIFGDGAAAICIEKGGEGGLLGRRFESHGDGCDLATLKAGGTRIRVQEGYDALVEGSRFQMDAFGIFKAAARVLPRVIDGALAEAGHDRSTVDLVICHQASAPGVQHVTRLFPDGERKVVDLFATHGNQIASSIPSVLAHAIESHVARPGMTILLLGTAAGISAGAMVIKL